MIDREKKDQGCFYRLARAIDKSRNIINNLNAEREIREMKMKLKLEIATDSHVTSCVTCTASLSLSYPSLSSASSIDSILSSSSSILLLLLLLSAFSLLRFH